MFSSEGGHRPHRPHRPRRSGVSVDFRSRRSECDITPISRRPSAKPRPIAVSRCHFAPYRCGFALRRCGFALYRCGFALYRCGFALYRCGFALYRCGFALYRCGFAPYHCGRRCFPPYRCTVGVRSPSLSGRGSGSRRLPADYAATSGLLQNT